MRGCFKKILKSPVVVESIQSDFHLYRELKSQIQEEIKATGKHYVTWTFYNGVAAVGLSTLGCYDSLSTIGFHTLVYGWPMFRFYVSKIDLEEVNKKL